MCSRLLERLLQRLLEVEPPDGSLGGLLLLLLETAPWRWLMFVAFQSPPSIVIISIVRGLLWASGVVIVMMFII